MNHHNHGDMAMPMPDNGTCSPKMAVSVYYRPVQQFLNDL